MKVPAIYSRASFARHPDRLVAGVHLVGARRTGRWPRPRHLDRHVTSALLWISTAKPVTLGCFPLRSIAHAGEYEPPGSFEWFALPVLKTTATEA
jgi:hypothetical protein